MPNFDELKCARIRLQGLYSRVLNPYVPSSFFNLNLYSSILVPVGDRELLV